VLVAGWQAESALLLDELRRARQTGRDVTLPPRLTTSQLVELRRDPQRFAARLARPVPLPPAPRAARGSRFHRWLEQRWGAPPLLDTDELPGGGEPELSDSDLAELQARFLAGPWADRVPLAVEAPFELVLGGRVVSGRIDAAFPAPGGRYDVIDVKTGDRPSDPAAAAVQLSVYRLAWAGLVGVDLAAVDAGFLYVRTGELVRPDLLDAEALAALLAGTVGAAVPG
jgi:DNA helicase II / ATP-dependent DNA helicase PcrA